MILALLVLCLLFWVGFHVTGALFVTLFWLCVKVPLAFVFMALGIAFCATIILIPVGVGFFKSGTKLLIPFV